jgi:hypothetical protein
MHLRSGLPNQDAALARPLEPDGSAMVAALADGHGGRRYVRSDVGARLAVEVACASVAVWWAEKGARGATTASLQSDVVPGLVNAWRQQVLEDAAARPFTEEEVERAGVPLDDDAVTAYGATMLLAVAVGGVVLLAQLGDGDITVVTANGEVHRPMPGDDRLVGGQTTSLCLPHPEHDFRHAKVGAASPAELVVLSSDGYGNSFVDPDWQVSVGRDLTDTARSRGIDAIAESLHGWLEESAEAGGDDVTVAVLYRHDAAARPAPVALTAAPARHPSPSRGISPAVVAAVGVGGLLVGGALGWLAAPSGDSPARATSTATTSAPAGGAVTMPATAATVVIGIDGSRVEFEPNPRDPRPRALSTDAGAGAATRLAVGAAIWEISDRGVLTARRTATAPATRIDIPDMTPGSLSWANGYVWVLDRTATKIAAIAPDFSRFPPVSVGRADLKPGTTVVPGATPTPTEPQQSP